MALRSNPKSISSLPRGIRRSAVLPVLAGVLLACTELSGQTNPVPAKVKPASAAKPRITASTTAASRVTTVSPQALRAHVDFLASDLLEGRNTPSRGLDIAAEYIASQFRRLGLEPGGANSGFFAPAPPSFQIVEGGQTSSVDLSQVNGTLPPMGRSRITKITRSDELTREDTANRIIFTTPEIAAYISGNRPTFVPGAIFAVGASAAKSEADVVNVWDPALKARFDAWPEGRTEASVSTLPPNLKNVVGILRGSDPKLRDQCVLLSAHYDHVGTGGTGEDRIFNGANDNASGVAGVIESAAQLVTMKPRRTVVFATFFGEEPGLLGSQFYSQAPSCPLAQTVAQLNLEQIGRTDDSEGPRVAAVTITGNDYSDVAAWVGKAALTVGGKVDGFNGDAYFARSDNLWLARAGIPAHTLATSYQFPDYHKVTDQAQKLDYENMALVTRIIAAGIREVANGSDTPRWRTTNPKAAAFWKNATPLSKPREASALKSGSLPASPKPQPSKPSQAR